MLPSPAAIPGTLSSGGCLHLSTVCVSHHINRDPGHCHNANSGDIHLPD